MKRNLREKTQKQKNLLKQELKKSKQASYSSISPLLILAGASAGEGVGGGGGGGGGEAPGGGDGRG